MPNGEDMVTHEGDVHLKLPYEYSVHHKTLYEYGVHTNF